MSGADCNCECINAGPLDVIGGLSNIGVHIVSLPITVCCGANVSEFCLNTHTAGVSDFNEFGDFGNVLFVFLGGAIDHQGRETGTNGLDVLGECAAVVEVERNRDIDLFGKVGDDLCKEGNVGVGAINQVENDGGVCLCCDLNGSARTVLIADVGGNDTIMPLAGFLQDVCHGYKHGGYLQLTGRLVKIRCYNKDSAALRCHFDSSVRALCILFCHEADVEELD